LANAPGNISIAKRDSGLLKESVINVSQVLTINKSFLVEKVGRLPDKKISALDEGLKLSLSIF
jgi:mRNA interferase MazF